MEKDRDEIYSKHIVGAIAGIESFIQGMNFLSFAQDMKTQLAVARELEIIGEASKKLSGKFKSARPAIPWRKVAGMRDILIHHYMDVDLREVWKSVTEDMPKLRASMKL